MSPHSLTTALAVAAAVALAGCKAASPSDAAQALGLNKDKPAQSAAPAAAAPPKPVPAQLPDVLARVNGDAITKLEFERALQVIEQRAGGTVPAEKRDAIYRGLLDNLVGLQLLRQEAAARKVPVTEAEVDARIGALKKQLGSDDVFNQMLATRKLTLDGLRAEQRSDVAVNKMMNETINPKTKPSPEQIDTFYKENLPRFQQPEQVKASHILISVPQGSDGVTKDATRAKAEEVLKQVKAGKDFAALAKEYSQDPGSAVNGGDLGYFRQGQMVGPFNEVAFKLAPGAVSDLVETQFGFHIIKVIDKKPAQTVPLESVRGQVAQFLETQNRQRESAAFIAGLRAKSKVEILI